MGSTRKAPLPTLDEVRQWPATVDVPTAGRTVDMGRNAAYDAVKNGTFPFRVVKIGHRLRVVTAEIVALLEATPNSGVDSAA